MFKPNKEEVAYIVVCFLTICVTLMFFLIMFIEIPDNNKETFSNMSNLIIGAWIGMIGYITSNLTKKSEDPILNVNKSGEININ